MPGAGRTIGPYRLESRLGRGAMGEVWRATDTRLDRVVAVKVLPRAFAKSTERRARMFREAKAAAQVPHPNVVTLFDILSAGGEDALVMELVEGETLAEIVEREGALEPARACRIMVELTSALAAAHARGILHRDIKLANLMLDADGAVKVLDFGLAKLRENGADAGASDIDPSMSMRSISLSETVDDSVAKTAPGRSEVPLGGRAAEGSSEDGDDRPDDGSLDETVPPGLAMATSGSSDMPTLETRAGALLGTPLYMAPEQFAGQAPNAKTDVYATGVVFYELLSGRPPYDADNVAELEAMVRSSEPEALAKDVPAALTDLAKRAMARQPSGRPTMAELLEGLERYAGTDRRHSRAVPIALAAIAAISAIAVAVAVIVFVTHGDGGAGTEVARPEAPGDKYVARALEEYNLFYNQKAAASLRAALKINADHPRAHAYRFLFGAVADGERDAALIAAKRAVNQPDIADDDRTLLSAAITMAERGPAAAAAELTDVSQPELMFWRAEMLFRARDYERAATLFETVLANAAPGFRGRIYDHYSAVLLYLGQPDRAVEIGKLYADAFAGEADAQGVYATTLAAVGRFDEAIERAEEARALFEGEDTVAGLAKVRAYRGDLETARTLYRKSLAAAGDDRKPIRRAALGYLYWLVGDSAAAAEATEPCLPTDGPPHWNSGQCLFVAGLANPKARARAVDLLRGMASAATDLRPAYGSPGVLADMLAARDLFAGSGCGATKPGSAPEDVDSVRRALAGALDFYAAYHIPFFTTYAECELVDLFAAAGQADKAIELTTDLRKRRPSDLGVGLRLAELLIDARSADVGPLLDELSARWPALPAKSPLAVRLAEAKRRAAAR